MSDFEIKKRDRFAKLKSLLKILLGGKECRTSQNMLSMNDDFKESTIANYLTPLIKTKIAEKRNTGIYGLNKQLINRDYFQDENHVSSFVSSVLCQIKPQEAGEVFEYFFQEIPAYIIKSMIYKSFADFGDADFIKSCLLSERYQVFHKMHSAGFNITLTIRYEVNNYSRHKKIVPLKSFIFIDKIYLCCYDLITDKIDILEYSSIVYYIIETFGLFNKYIKEEEISEAISNFQEKNMQTSASISFVALPELMITLSHLNLIDSYENIEIPNEKYFEEEKEQKQKTSSDINKFIDISQRDICQVNGSLITSIFDLTDETKLGFKEFSNVQEKKAFHIYAPKINLVYIVRNYFEYIELIDYSQIEEEIGSFIIAVLNASKKKMND